MPLSTAARLTLAGSIALVSGAAIALAPDPSAPAEPVSDPVEVMRCGVGMVEPLLQEVPTPTQTQAGPVIDVVFVLDTTGSMGGLIEGARQKIWSIASEIAQAQPAPVVRMGLVAYRDRGDDYIVRHTRLSSDLDEVYARLMQLQAAGGGDTPESVNEALFTAIERSHWSSEEDALRLVYLVGDAPPQMGYDDDVKYRATCRFARERGVHINTVQCGVMSQTRPVWQEIAQLANGAYAAIEQDGGVQRIATPYDEQIRAIDLQIRATMIDYGDPEMMRQQSAKRARASKIDADSSTEALADRAAYNYSATGSLTLLGHQELVSDFAGGGVDLAEIEREHLPEPLRGLSEQELRSILEAKQIQRERLRAVMDELNMQRRAFVSSKQEEIGADSFDRQVVETLREQAAQKGIRIGTQGGDAKEAAASEPGAPESPKMMKRSPDRKPVTKTRPEPEPESDPEAEPAD